MNADFLLQAIGLLDDDLIEEARQPFRRRPTLLFRARRWVSVAACLAILLTAGYVVTHLGMGGGSSGSASASAGGSAPNAGSGNTASGNTDGSASSSAGSAQEPGGSIFLNSDVYLLTGEIADTLPPDVLSLGVLSALYPDAPSPSTDREDLTGREVFQRSDGTVLYIQLDGGLWAVASLVQP